MEIATARIPSARMPSRQLALLALMTLLLAVTLAAYIGSRATHVPPPFGPAENGRLVYAADGDIVVRDALQTAPVTLISGPTDDHDPGYSPDGTRLLYISTQGGRDYLMSATADGRSAHQIVNEPLVDASVSWAPDSKRVAVVSSPRGIPTLTVVAADGSGATAIGLNGLRPTEVLWRPPDGHQLLVRAIKPTELRADQSPYTPIQFYIVDVDGPSPGAVRSVGIAPHDDFGPDWDNSGPEWSLDGQAIYYNVVDPAPGDPPGRYRIHRVDADGTDDQALPGPALNVNEAWPRLSPDGTWLLVEHFTWPNDPDPHLTLAVMPSDGSAPAHDVGPKVNDGKDVDRSWSPDGTRILARTGESTMISIDPVTGTYEPTGWSATAFPDWQRRAR